MSTVGVETSKFSFSSFCFHWSPVENLSQSSSSLLLSQQVHLPSASSTILTLMNHQSSLASLISPRFQAISFLCLLLKHTILMSKSPSWKLNFLSFLPILPFLPLLLTTSLSFSIPEISNFMAHSTPFSIPWSQLKLSLYFSMVFPICTLSSPILPLKYLFKVLHHLHQLQQIPI